MEADDGLKALAGIPSPSQQNIAIRVTPEAEKALLQGHPWVYAESITYQSQTGQPGDLAVVFNRKRKFLAVGLYDPYSFIKIRLLESRKPVPVGEDLFRERIASASTLRHPLLQKPIEKITTGFRLVHGENDGLPGLIIDRYEKTYVLKLYTSAWIPHLREVLSAFSKIHPAERIVFRLSRNLMEKSEALYGLRDGQILAGLSLSGPVLFWENGLRFEADLIHGQKTGFFFDQRENRERVERFANNKTVLNVFSYTGGFSVYAARGGAAKITSVDSSRPVLEAASRNFDHNQDILAAASAKHETMEADAFQALDRMGINGLQFDIVIIDPPAFAQKGSQTTAALSAYERLTILGLHVLAPGGILVQASCSSRVPADTFFEAVHHAASQAGRPLHEIERTGHALDHPIKFKEGAYLKCLFAVA